MAFVEYGASVPSDFDDVIPMFWGERKLVLLLQGYMSSASLKTSRPHGLSCEEKSMGHRKVNVWS
jgi:hypothetical protein